MQIVAQRAEFVMGLKSNQSRLQEAVEDLFTVAQVANVAGVSHDYAEELDKGTGRLEVRRYWISDTLSTLPESGWWSGLFHLFRARPPRYRRARLITRWPLLLLVDLPVHLARFYAVGHANLICIRRLDIKAPIRLHVRLIRT